MNKANTLVHWNFIKVYHKKT